MRFCCLMATAAFSLLPWHTVRGAEAKPSKPEIAAFSLDRPIIEAPTADDLIFATVTPEPLKNLIARMKKVPEDKDVKAVVMLLGNTSVGSGQTEEIRRAMDEIKSAGKEIHVHADSLTMSNYVLLSGASRVCLVPTGIVLLEGIRAEQPYLRGMLDLIRVTPDFIACGDYKSAAEMFMRTGPSDQADQMVNWLLDSIYATSVKLIAEGRGVSPRKVRQWIDGGLYTAEKAREAGIIDGVFYRQDLVGSLKEKYGDDVVFNQRYGREKRDEIDLSSPFGMLKIWAELLAGPTKKKPTKDAVAIIYVEGMIVPGKPTPSPFGSGGIAYSTPIRKALDEAASDDSIKAVVLRVDSPGGSATASEIILNATKRLKDKKPFVVSMGNVAGSGGYYVACGADTIFAGASTITASIGVVGGKFATTEMWNKIGVTWHSTNRGASAAMFSSRQVFSDEEREKFNELMTDIYQVFKNHVVNIRGDRLTKDIEEIAGGRVFTGQQALKLGLIDKIGGLDEAIAHVADEAQLEDYDVRVLPKPKNFVELLLGGLGDQDGEDQSISVSLESLTLSRSASLFDAAIPYLEELEPRRVRAVKSALQQLRLLEREQVILAMPLLQIVD